MKKLLIFSALSLFSGCAQVNVASSVNNIIVIKVQYDSDMSDMSGSKVEDIKPSQEAGDVEATP